MTATNRDELLAALIRERFGPPPASEPGPKPAHGRVEEYDGPRRAKGYRVLADYDLLTTSTEETP